MSSIDETNNPTTISDSTINETEKPIVCIFKKQNSRSKNIRKRKGEDNILNSTTSNQDDDDNNNNTNEDDKDTIQVTKKLKTKINSYSNNDSSSSLSPETISTIDKEKFSYETSGLDKALKTDKELSSMEIPKDEDKFNNATSAKFNNEDKTYRGLDSYEIKTNSKPSSNGGDIAKAGPVRNHNFRIAHRIDYQPDVCKDYKQSGQCSFGDSCKFMHDRGDYKSSWEIDKEYNEQQDKKKGDNSQVEQKTNVTDDLPFACFICKKQYNNPVMTQCKHFFCESCILSQKGKICPLCKKPTNGAFSYPQKMLDKLMIRSKLHFENLNEQETE